MPYGLASRLHGPHASIVACQRLPCHVCAWHEDRLCQLAAWKGHVLKSVWHVQGPHGWTLQAFASLLQALVPALLMNICIVGLNQIFDVPIDRINKPYLPLASGEFTMRMGQSIVRLSAKREPQSTAVPPRWCPFAWNLCLSWHWHGQLSLALLRLWCSVGVVHDKPYCHCVAIGPHRHFYQCIIVVTHLGFLIAG